MTKHFSANTGADSGVVTGVISHPPFWPIDYLFLILKSVFMLYDDFLLIRHSSILPPRTCVSVHIFDNYGALRIPYTQKSTHFRVPMKIFYQNFFRFFLSHPPLEHSRSAPDFNLRFYNELACLSQSPNDRKSKTICDDIV